jgi:hypothetical protein
MLVNPPGPMMEITMMGMMILAVMPCRCGSDSDWRQKFD